MAERSLPQTQPETAPLRRHEVTVAKTGWRSRKGEPGGSGGMPAAMNNASRKDDPAMRWRHRSVQDRCHICARVTRPPSVETQQVSRGVGSGTCDFRFTLQKDVEEQRHQPTHERHKPPGTLITACEAHGRAIRQRRHGSRHDEREGFRAHQESQPVGTEESGTPVPRTTHGNPPVDGAYVEAA